MSTTFEITTGKKSQDHTVQDVIAALEKAHGRKLPAAEPRQYRKLPPSNITAPTEQDIKQERMEVNALLFNVIEFGDRKSLIGGDFK